LIDCLDPALTGHTLVCYLSVLLGSNLQSAPAGKWIEVNADAPITARHEACFVMVNNPTVGRRAYLVGGRDIQDVDIYNPRNRTWTKGAPAPIELHHMQCVAVQGKLWIMAAWTGSYPREQNPTNAFVYDPATNTWATKTALPLARRRGSTAVVVSLDERKIYVSHGTIGGHETANYATALPFLDVYDIAADSWTPLSDSVPNPRDHTGGALINGRICVTGGRNGAEINWPPVAPTDCYNLTSGQWKVEAPIPQVRSGSSYGTTCNGQLMIAGGEGDGQAWQNVDVFDGTSWTTMSNLNVARHGSGLAVDCVCHQIHIASGSHSQGGGFETKSVETFFPSGSDTPCTA
jgi:N-acetylneuraminic acid mutarotase